MRWIYFLLCYGGAIIILSLSACSRNLEKQSNHIRFDLAGLINSQVSLLSEKNYGIQKVTKLGSTEEVVEHYPDSSGWVKELNIIKSTDINKPGLSPYYDMISSDSSWCSIDTYILNDTGRSNILYQKIYRYKKTDQLVRIRIKQKIDNPIYHSGRYIDVAFKKLKEDLIVVDSIIVNGYQKIIFLDTTFYNSISKIIK
jgi:hypothetical protein